MGCDYPLSFLVVQLTAVVENDPNNLDAKYRMAQVLEQSGQKDQALELITQCKLARPAEDLSPGLTPSHPSEGEHQHRPAAAFSVGGAAEEAAGHRRTRRRAKAHKGGAC
jgi:hypothetical protein